MRKPNKKMSPAVLRPTALVAGQIRSELHLCPRCWAPVVRLVDARAPDASAHCQCRHFHAFVATDATLAPRFKSPPTVAHEESEAPAPRRLKSQRVA